MTTYRAADDRYRRLEYRRLEPLFQRGIAQVAAVLAGHSLRDLGTEYVDILYHH